LSVPSLDSTALRAVVSPAASFIRQNENAPVLSTVLACWDSCRYSYRSQSVVVPGGHTDVSRSAS
jgi:hypothetical protein